MAKLTAPRGFAIAGYGLLWIVGILAGLFMTPNIVAAATIGSKLAGGAPDSPGKFQAFEPKILPFGSSGQGRAEAVAQGDRSAPCKREIAKDYLASLSQSWPVRKVPQSGKLPFGPQGIRLFRTGNGPTVDGGAIGFYVTDIAINQRRRLNWVIRTTLVKVNATGQPVRVIDRKVDHVATRNIDEGPRGRQRFHVPANPANYRVDITLEKRSGEMLGSFGEYFRVMKARYKAVMTLSDSDVVPGQTIRARIENLGTEPIAAKVDVAVDWYDGTQWIGREKVYRGGKVFDGSTYVSGGETGPCFNYKVPDDLGYGKFRVTEEIRRYLKGGQRRRSSAVFRVSPAG
jgi:hypothetical protein